MNEESIVAHHPAAARAAGAPRRHIARRRLLRAVRLPQLPAARRGGFGPALLAFGFLVYGLALVAYTFLPVPQVDDVWCAAHPALGHPQLDPLRFLDDIAREQRTPGLAGLPANAAEQQVAFNVALFVPLGAYLRHYFRRGVVAVVLAGVGVSLLIELTQVTGDWFVFPCPYRLFDVDDLLANSLGAALGVLFAPLLHLIDGRHAALPAAAARPVTARRRLLGMLVDLVAVVLLGGLLTTALDLVVRYGFDARAAEQPWGASRPCPDRTGACRACSPA